MTYLKYIDQETGNNSLFSNYLLLLQIEFWKLGNAIPNNFNFHTK